MLKLFHLAFLNHSTQMVSYSSRKKYSYFSKREVNKKLHYGWVLGTRTTMKKYYICKFISKFLKALLLEDKESV